MVDSRITSNRCNHIWLCNQSLDGDTLQLQNDRRPCDVAQSYTSSDSTQGGRMCPSGEGRWLERLYVDPNDRKRAIETSMNINMTSSL